MNALRHILRVMLSVIRKKRVIALALLFGCNILYSLYLDSNAVYDKFDQGMSDSLICVSIIERLGFEDVSLERMAEYRFINGHKRLIGLTVDARGLKWKDESFFENIANHYSTRHVALSGIQRLSYLTSLRFQNVPVYRVPREIGKLVQLEELEFENAGLDELPDELGNLSQLRILFLGNNNLKKIPSTLCGLKKLETLSITGNPLTEFPGDVTCLISLHNVYIDKKHLDALPSQLQSNAQTR